MSARVLLPDMQPAPGRAGQENSTKLYRGGWRANTSHYKRDGKTLDIPTELMRSKLFRSLANLILKSFGCS